LTESKAQTVPIYALLFVISTLWGGVFTAGKITVREMPPLTAAAVRFVIASIVLLIALHVLEPDRRRMCIREVPQFILLGITGYFLMNYSFLLGLKYTSASSAAILVATNPIMVTLLSLVFLRERLSPISVLGIALSVMGVVLVVSEGSLETILDTQFNLGNALVLLSVLNRAIYSVYGRRVMEQHSPLAATTYACLAGTVLLVGFSLFESPWHHLANSTLDFWMAISYLGIVAAAFANVGYFRAVNVVGASRSSVFFNVVPISALVIAHFVLGETITAIHVAGAATVIVGVLLTTR
jgi:drug/metabolite transporter (DMT)-like permease